MNNQCLALLHSGESYVQVHASSFWIERDPNDTSYIDRNVRSTRMKNFDEQRCVSTGETGVHSKPFTRRPVIADNDKLQFKTGPAALCKAHACDDRGISTPWELM